MTFSESHASRRRDAAHTGYGTPTAMVRAANKATRRSLRCVRRRTFHRVREWFRKQALKELSSLARAAASSVHVASIRMQ